MQGGSVEDALRGADGHRLQVEDALLIARHVCDALDHAHRQGVVHRDLKPGNIWLTADGTAKLGDFGLAVALDRSRLTVAGMMVGTVAYIAPEQALGGRPDARSDLYALGASLYEMVTGQPPFLGDDAVAVISQHINTPPVSPAWLNADVPPTLDALILRLLEKDPARRPQSAAETRELLASVASAPPPRADSASATQPVAAGASPLYRRTFIGREPELRRLHAAFDAALSGDGALMMVVGEPGIGKTSVCEQLATYVALRGGRTLVGHSRRGPLSLGWANATRRPSAQSPQPVDPNINPVFMTPPEPQDEDCLYLNVWTPSVDAPGLPVWCGSTAVHSRPAAVRNRGTTVRHWRRVTSLL